MISTQYILAEKNVVLFKIASVKTLGNGRGQPGNGYDGLGRFKFYNTNSGEFVLIPNEAGMRQHKFT